MHQKKMAYELRDICKALGYAARALETIQPFMQACLDQILRDRDIHEGNIQHLRRSVEKYEHYEVPETFTVDHLRLYKLILKTAMISYGCRRSGQKADQRHGCSMAWFCRCMKHAFATYANDCTAV